MYYLSTNKPLIKKQCKKWLSSKRCHFVKTYFYGIKLLQANVQCVYIVNTKYQDVLGKSCGTSWTPRICTTYSPLRITKGNTTWPLTPSPPPVVYTTARSKAVVPMLFLFYLHYEALHVRSCPALCLCVSSVLLAFWSPCLGKRELVFVLIVHLFVSYAHVNLCHFFSSSWCQGLAATSACGSSWTILFTFWPLAFKCSIINVHLININVSAQFNEFPSLPFQDIKEKPKRQGWTHTRTNNMKIVSPPPQTQFAGCIINLSKH